MPDPLAYLLTWTCHGSWLPGDERGSVDAIHNEYGTPALPADGTREMRNAQRMNACPTLLDERSRRTVDTAIRDHCEVRKWTLIALNVRTNHVHCVVMATGYAPEIVMGQLKSWATRRLRMHGFRNSAARVWTREGSTRYLFDHDSVRRAIDYVLNQQ